MSKLIWTFPLLMAALIGIAIYVQVTSSTLSLPISTGITVLTILLPLFAIANLFFTPVLNRLAKSSKVQQLLLPALHVLQGGLTVVIATLAAQGFVPGPSLKCELDNSWQLLWHNKDWRAIERIQNAFDCCGLHSVRDRSWPVEDCQKTYGRHTSCDAPWSASMRTTSGLQFAVAVLCGIIQLAHLAYFRRLGGRHNSTPDFKYFGERVEGGDNGRVIEEPYHDGEESGVGEDRSSSQRALPAAQDSQNDAPHRVEPSGLGHDEANEWRDE